MQANRAVAALGIKPGKPHDDDHAGGGGGGHGGSHGGGHGHSHGGQACHGHGEAGGGVSEGKLDRQINDMFDDRMGMREPNEHKLDFANSLEEACERGVLSVAVAQVAVGVDVKRTDSTVQATPLHWAAFKGHLHLIRFVLDRGADVNARDSRGQTPLMWAVSEGRIEACNLLLERGADPSVPDSRECDAYSMAVQKGYLSIVHLCHTYKPYDPESEDQDGHNALVWASYKGYLDIAKYLYEVHNTPVNRFDDNGRSPLHWAAREGHTEVVIWLLSLNKLNPEVKDKDGLRPIDWARMHYHYSTVWALEQKLTVSPKKVYGTVAGLLNVNKYHLWFQAAMVIPLVMIPVWYYVIARWLIPYLAFAGLLGLLTKNWVIAQVRPPPVRNSVPAPSLKDVMGMPSTPEELLGGIPETNYRDPGVILVWSLTFLFEVVALVSLGYEPSPVLFALVAGIALTFTTMKASAFADIVPSGSGIKEDPMLRAVEKKQLQDCRWRRIYNTNHNIRVPLRAFHCKELDVIIREYSGWCVLADCPISRSNRRSYLLFAVFCMLFHAYVAYNAWTIVVARYCANHELPAVQYLAWNIAMSAMPCKAPTDDSWLAFLTPSAVNRDAFFAVVMAGIGMVAYSVIACKEFFAAIYAVTQIERLHGTMPSTDGGLTPFVRNGKSVFSTGSFVTNFVQYCTGTLGNQWRDATAIPPPPSATKFDKR